MTALYMTHIYGAELKDPYISGLNISTEENLIRLIWSDSTDNLSKYMIYRSKKVINNENFNNSLLIGEAAPKDEYFIDYPATKEDYYYAVLASDTSGRIYDLFIPYRNISSIPARVTTLSTAEELAAVISEIEVTVSDNKIQISFVSSRDSRNLIIYRSTKPILIKDDLISASLITTIHSSINSYTDHPVPGAAYFMQYLIQI